MFKNQVNKTKIKYIFLYAHTRVPKFPPTSFIFYKKEYHFVKFLDRLTLTKIKIFLLNFKTSKDKKIYDL